MQLQFLSERHGSFPGKADHTQAVRPVGGDFEIDHMVIQPHLYCHVIAGLIVPLQDQDAVFYGIREVMLGCTELLERAQHSVRRDTAQRFCFDLNAARQKGTVQRRRNEIPLMHILCAGADLNGLSVSDVDLADPHMVRVGVAFDGEDFPHLHVLHGKAEILCGFHFGPGNRHCLGKGSVPYLGDRQVNKLSEPFSGTFHFSVPPSQNCSRKRSSFSKMRRRSEILYSPMARRSSPMPKAQPE